MDGLKLSSFTVERLKLGGFKEGFGMGGVEIGGGIEAGEIRVLKGR